MVAVFAGADFAGPYLKLYVTGSLAALDLEWPVLELDQMLLESSQSGIGNVIAFWRYFEKFYILRGRRGMFFISIAPSTLTGAMFDILHEALVVQLQSGIIESGTTEQRFDILNKW